MRTARIKEVAEMLNVSIRSLQRMEKENIGPQPIRIKRNVVYDLSDVEAYLVKLKKEQSKKIYKKINH